MQYSATTSGALAAVAANVDILTSRISAERALFLDKLDPSFIDGPARYIVKSADETVNNSDTLQPDDNLSFTNEANELWHFEGVLFIESTAGADFKMAIIGPGTDFGSWGVIANSPGGDEFADVAALDASISIITSGTLGIIRFWGAVKFGASSGSLSIRWAQNTAEVSDTKVLAGSYLIRKRASVL